MKKFIALPSTFFVLMQIYLLLVIFELECPASFDIVSVGTFMSAITVQ